MLWRFTKGHRKPDANTIARLHDLTDGRIPANGWGDEVEQAKAAS